MSHPKDTPTRNSTCDELLKDQCRSINSLISQNKGPKGLRSLRPNFSRLSLKLFYTLEHLQAAPDCRCRGGLAEGTIDPAKASEPCSCKPDCGFLRVCKDMSCCGLDAGRSRRKPQQQSDLAIACNSHDNDHASNYEGRARRGRHSGIGSRNSTSTCCGCSTHSNVSHRQA